RPARLGRLWHGEAAPEGRRGVRGGPRAAVERARGTPGARRDRGRVPVGADGRARRARLAAGTGSRLNAPRLVFTSVIRGAALRETSGIVGVVDLERREVVSRSPVPESEHRANDPNPRGGVRGARGVAASGDRLVVANSDRLLVFDAAWSLVCELSHPWLG